MKFTQLGLHPKILEAVEKSGYKTPTPVQLQAIPIILSGRDVVVSAPTGTGKTAAYVLPALHRLLTTSPSSVATPLKSTTTTASHAKNAIAAATSAHPSNKSSLFGDNRPGKARILILAPTRELATQITQVIGKYAKFMQVSVVNLIGGMAYLKQKKKLASKVDIIVATPGRLIDYMENHRLDLSRIEMLVIDEADRMLDMGFIKDIKKIVAVTAKTRQTLLLSATASDALMSILQQLLKNPARIDLEPEEKDIPLIQQELYMADDNGHKKKLLHHFLSNSNIFKAIIFSATKRNAKRLVDELDDDGYSVAALHGDLKQGARNRTLAQFREGKIQFLIATDVAARGIDVFDVTHIINYDLPKFAEDYVHRIGRTGRAGKTGIAISFALSTDYKFLRGIERFTAKKLPLATIAGLEAKEKPLYSQSSKRISHGKRKPQSHAATSSHAKSPQRGAKNSKRSWGAKKPQRDKF